MLPARAVAAACCAAVALAAKCDEPTYDKKCFPKGTEYKKVSKTKFETCCSACEKDDECAVYTERYEDKECYLYKVAPAKKTSSEACDSGKIRDGPGPSPPAPTPPSPPSPPSPPVPPSPAGGNGIVIQAIPSSLKKFTKWFTQYVNIFGVNILAAKGVEKSHLLHAANVMAQYLDNNEDSKVDSPEVGAALIKAGATLVMFETADNKNMDNFFDNAPDGNYQDLENDEIVPERSQLVKHTEHDATVEEVFHLLTCNGWANVWPDVFDCSKKSQIGKTMTATIGDCGYAFNHTHKKTCTGKFHYDDKTCDWGCLAVEYTYWATTTVLGYQNGPPLGPKNRCADIGDEWEMCTADALQKYDKGMYDIIVDPTYKLATVLPDGAYKGKMPQLPPTAPGLHYQNACNGADMAAARRRTAARRAHRQARRQ